MRGACLEGRPGEDEGKNNYYRDQEREVQEQTALVHSVKIHVHKGAVSQDSSLAIGLHQAFGALEAAFCKTSKFKG